MKNKVFSLVGILAITLVFGLTVVGCAMFEVVATDNQTQQPDGKGGKINVVNTTEHANGIRYFIVGPNSDGTYTSRSSIYDLTSRSIKPFYVYNDGSYLIYYRAQRSDENGNLPKGDNYLSWQSKLVYVSNNETVRVEIP